MMNSTSKGNSEISATGALSIRACRRRSAPRWSVPCRGCRRVGGLIHAEIGNNKKVNATPPLSSNDTGPNGPARRCFCCCANDAPADLGSPHPGPPSPPTTIPCPWCPLGWSTFRRCYFVTRNMYEVMTTYFHIHQWFWRLGHNHCGCHGHHGSLFSGYSVSDRLMCRCLCGSWFIWPVRRGGQLHCCSGLYPPKDGRFNQVKRCYTSYAQRVNAHTCPSLFEVMIRYVRGLLGAYELSGRKYNVLLAYMFVGVGHPQLSCINV